MKILKSIFILFIITSISLYSQIYLWKTETKDIVSHLSCDKICDADLRYSFITDDNKLVLVGYIEADGYYGFDVKSSAYPYIRVFNTSTGQSEKEKLFGMPHKVKLGTGDTVEVTVQWPIKTIKVGKEYWFISASLLLNIEFTPVPYLVKMDEDFKIIEKVDITNKDNADFRAPMSLLTYHNGIFYDENKKHFICFAPHMKSLLVKQFDTTLNIIDQREEELDIPSTYPNCYNDAVTAERLDNGNYVVWFTTIFRSTDAKYLYFLNSHRLYDSNFNLIKVCNRIRDGETGYIDSGIVKEPKKIIKNPNTGGYFIYTYSNTGLLVEEYTSTGDSVRTIYFDASDVFPECNITDDVLYRDGKFTFIGLKEETENGLADNTYYTVYLIETDETGNVTWQYKVPNNTYLGARPEVILGEDANTYYISGVNRNPGVYDRYELGYFNFKVMKINYYGSISETNQSSDIIVAPNPIASTFTVDYTLQTSGQLTITITDLLGEQITEEYNSYAEAGVFTKTINIEKLLPGTYYLNILHDGKITVKKILKI